MAQTRLHVAGSYGAGSDMTLGSEQARYLGRVLRLRVGDDLLVFDGEGSEFQATITKMDKTSITVRVGEKTHTSAESPLRVHLVQGISRGERMDFIVQKATELGVKRITPVLAEFGVVKLDADRAAKRREHWHRVAISACEQCGRARVPLIDAPIRLKTWFGSRPQQVDSDIILKPGASTPLRRIGSPVTKICLLIGPEGGFSRTEYEDAEVAGFQAVSLGPRVLRTETAATASIAILQSEWGDLG